jgi:hypothetical protein
MEVINLKKSIIFSTIISILLFVLLLPILFRLTNYLHPIVLGTVLFCLWGLITFALLFIRNEIISIKRSTIYWIIAFYTFSLIVLLFFRPSDQTYHSYNLIPFSTIAFFLSGKVNFLVSFYNLVANIALFIPYGIYLMLRKRKFTKFQYLYLPLITISMIELLQFFTHRGSLDIDDLILNMCGVFLGYYLYPVYRRVIHFK